MKQFKIYMFEIVFENCETLLVKPDAIKRLSYIRENDICFQSDCSSGKIVVVEECIKNVHFTIDLNVPNAVYQPNPSIWTEDPIKRLKESNDITHLTINDVYYQVMPYEEDGYSNKCQVNEYDEERNCLSVSIKE